MTGDRDTFIFLIETGIAHYRLRGERNTQADEWKVMFRSQSGLAAIMQMCPFKNAT